MDLFVNLKTRPQPQIRARLAVLMIVLIGVIILWQCGHSLPDALTVVLGAGTVSAAVSRAVLPRPLPPGEQGR